MKAFVNQIRILTTFILILCGTNIFAHSVQVAYCISCTGQLRLYVEHWHGTEDPSSTQMTIQYNDGSGVQTITGSPIANLQDIPKGQLPGCISVPVTFGSCASSANTYNDWVYYDFVNPPTNMPITITVISGSNAFTMDCGGMYPASITFTIPPISNVSEIVSSQTTCNNSNFATTTFTSGGVTNWSNSNPSIGLAGSGTGNIPSFTAINNTTLPQTATITFTNGCNTGSFTYVVNPGPNPLFTFPLSSSGDHSNYCKNSNIVFSLTNGTGSTASWTFGDGGTSTVSNPSHSYTSLGTFSVNVLVTGANSCTATATQTLSIYTPTANFTTTNNCLNSTSNFTNTSLSPQTIAAYNWDFGNATGTANGSNPTYVYPSSGTFNTQLTITAVDGCTATVTKPITIYPNPAVTFTAASVCLGVASNFSNTSSVTAPDNIATWGWDFENNASIDNTTQAPSHTYPAVGIYNVALTATSNNGCVTTSVVPVLVNVNPTVIFSPNDVCENTAVPMNNTSTIPLPNNIALYSWNFGSGASSTTSSNQNPTNVMYPNYGIKTITLTLTANTGCTATATQTVMINPIPIPNFSFANKCINTQPNTFDASSSSVALGSITTYFWAYGDGNFTPNSMSVINNYAVAGIYNPTLTVTSNKGCIAYISKQVEVYQKPILSITSTTVCYNVAMSFTAVSATNSGNVVSWAWDFNNNVTTTEGVGKSTIFNFPSEGTQTVVLNAITDHGCVNTYSTTVYVNYLPKPAFTVNDPDGCAEHCVVFYDATPALTTPETNVKWKWVYGDGTTTNATNANNKNHCYQNTSSNQVKNYDVKLIVTSSVGCKDSISKPSFITVYPNPIANFADVPEFGNVVQPQINFTNQSIDYTNWYWNFGDGSKQDSIKQNPIHFYETDDAKSYYTRLIVKNQYGCTDTAFKQIDIGPEFIFYIPNAFSPLNEDGINDVFKGVAIGVDKYEMWVFDRWGATVFYSDEISKGWNGKVQGQDNTSKQEVYIWKVKLKDVLGKDHAYVGHVTLLK